MCTIDDVLYYDEDPSRLRVQMMHVDLDGIPTFTEKTYEGVLYLENRSLSMRHGFYNRACDDWDTWLAVKAHLQATCEVHDPPDFEGECPGCGFVVVIPEEEEQY